MMTSTASPASPASPSPSPGAVEALYATGHWLYSRDRFAHAQSVFRAMIHLAPDDERGWLALGACHEALGQAGIALELYTAAAGETQAPRCQLARARILRRRGLEGEAHAALREADRLAEHRCDYEVRRLVAVEREQP
jgi:tetratricopeptide (TPR) repeat protein